MLVIAYTASSSIAMAINGLFLWIIIRRELRRRVRQDPDRARLNVISLAFISIWLAILLEDCLMFGAGLGIIVGLHWLGYLLVAMPGVSIVVGAFALRWLR